MSLEEVIRNLTIEVERNSIALEKFNLPIVTTGFTSNPSETKPQRKRRTKAEIEMDEKKKDPTWVHPKEETDPTSLDDNPVASGIKTETDSLLSLDNPETHKAEEEGMTEKKVRDAASELVQKDPDGTKGLDLVRTIITQLGFETLKSVTSDKYVTLYDNFKLAVKQWKK